MISNNEFLQAVLESAAWEKISAEEALSMDLLEKYQDKLSWNHISENRNIAWTVDGLKKFAHRLNWSKFSAECPDSFICETTLREFRSKWDWKILSARELVYNNWDLLDKFADNIDWAEVIGRWNLKEPVEFLKRYENRIPMAQLQDSALWNGLIEKRTSELYQEIIGAK